ncbi:cisplatin damage response ATP-dependent DNA ligase [Microvirga pudoricolor]|uniref:cisplatin damage response ATP-dependent DNA ligase n=1 Tax=Microvirga pudoricolor TaxID=2778729 RepID=UPI00194EA436|nr:cisplatin damage response ATP-dependent DNA ligase [Microvirga pudoricolor]MBM6592930.1 cisplatin damage response ATP-dependent DNA ligase [Microvirga pudoricolor]
MNRFAALLDRVMYEPRRNAKLRLLVDYFRHTPDPDRGYALAAMTGALMFKEAKAGLIRGLVEERVDPVLFRMSYHYVGDLAETVALIWPAPHSQVNEARPNQHDRPSPPLWGRDGEGGAHGSTGLDDLTVGAIPPSRPLSRPPLPHKEGGDFGAPAMGHNNPPPHVPSISEVVETLATTSKSDLPAKLTAWLDALDEEGRWALLKLITRELRVGVSARLAKTAVAQLGGMEADEVELIWHGLEAPYENLFAWVEGRGEKPESGNPAPFRPPMLSHPLEDEDFPKLDARDFLGEWKWDGIRLQAVSGHASDGRPVRRIYSRTGEDVSRAFPDLVEALAFDGAIDGELLIVREGRVQTFNVLQQRLNRKAVTPKLIDEFPAHLRVYDILAEGEEDLRALPFAERRKRLEAFVARLNDPRIDLSPMVAFTSWDELEAARADPASVGAGPDADAIEGCMIKRADSPYLPGRPKGYWYKWKRDPYIVDAVMMYGQRGHGKRSSFYSDYTFGVWRDGPNGEELVPVGKAYHGFTDEELVKLDRYVRNHTVNRFGPVREVEYGRDRGLVLEVAFEGLQRSTRHKSGVAMRFPRISRIRWDKPSAEADRIETLEKILERGEKEVHPLEGTPVEGTAQPKDAP